MKLLLVVFLGILGSFADCRSHGKVLNPMVGCVPENCKLPDCFCSGTVPPPVSTSGKIPQIVYLTFENGINVINYPVYQELLGGRKNPNGASISATFYINHEYNDYSFTHQLWRTGNEIGLKSITHKTETTYWRNLNYSGWVDEMGGQRQLVSKFAKIPEEEIVGIRAPFLQVGGDEMYRAIYDQKFKYDSSRPTVALSPDLWPYTADYDTVQDCQIEPCPRGSYPGFWVSPIVTLRGNNGKPCSFLDGCLPWPNTTQELVDNLKQNFENHYLGERAPFGLTLDSKWILNDEAPWIKPGIIQFLDYILSLGDAYVLSVKKGLEWVKNPVDADQAKEFAPWQDPEAPPRDQCRISFACTYGKDQLPPELKGERIMKSCVMCPSNYPWLRNPLGD